MGRVFLEASSVVVCVGGRGASFIKYGKVKVSKVDAYSVEVGCRTSVQFLASVVSFQKCNIL